MEIGHPSTRVVETGLYSHDDVILAVASTPVLVVAVVIVCRYWNWFTPTLVIDTVPTAELQVVSLALQ